MYYNKLSERKNWSVGWGGRNGNSNSTSVSFCDETEAWGSICSLLNNSKQYRTQVMDGQRVGAGGRQIRVDGQARRSRQAAGIVIGETIRVIHRQAEQQGINAQKWSPGQIKTLHWGAGTTVFYGEWCECVYWWQVQTISPRYVGGESNELVIRRGLPLVVWERRCKGLVCNREVLWPGTPPRPRPEWAGASESWLPRSPLPLSDHLRVLTPTHEK